MRHAHALWAKRVTLSPSPLYTSHSACCCNCTCCAHRSAACESLRLVLHPHGVPAARVASCGTTAAQRTATFSFHSYGSTHTHIEWATTAKADADAEAEAVWSVERGVYSICIDRVKGKRGSNDCCCCTTPITLDNTSNNNNNNGGQQWKRILIPVECAPQLQIMPRNYGATFPKMLHNVNGKKKQQQRQQFEAYHQIS